MFAARLVFSRGLSSLRKVPLQHRNGKNVKHLQGKMVPLLLCLLLLNGLNLADSISLDPDGGYKDIVIRINKDVPEDQCPQIIAGLKVRLIFLEHIFGWILTQISCAFLKERVDNFQKCWWSLSKLSSSSLADFSCVLCCPQQNYDRNSMLNTTSATFLGPSFCECAALASFLFTISAAARCCTLKLQVRCWNVLTTCQDLDLVHPPPCKSCNFVRVPKEDMQTHIFTKTCCPHSGKFDCSLQIHDHFFWLFKFTGKSVIICVKYPLASVEITTLTTYLESYVETREIMLLWFMAKHFELQNEPLLFSKVRLKNVSISSKQKMNIMHHRYFKRIFQKMHWIWVCSNGFLLAAFFCEHIGQLQKSFFE